MSSRPLQPGDRFADRYEVVQRLGAGAHASVYLAVDRRDRTPVALKLLAVADEPKLATRFLREAKLLSQLNAPGVVRVHDYGEVDGTLYMAQQAVEGEDLKSILAARQLTAAHVADVLTHVLGALATVHREGILHRDVKPANIMVAHEPGGPMRATLIDFGVARDPGQSANRALTTTGAVIGTEAYMAPEQIFGEPLTPATDLYAVALVAIEMMYGAQGVRAWQATSMHRQLADGPRHAPLPVAEPLRSVIARLGAAMPVERYQSAEAALGDLHPQPPKTSTAHVRKRSKNRPLLSVALIAIGVIVGFGLVRMLQEDSAPSSSPRPESRARPSPIAPANDEAQPIAGPPPIVAFEPSAPSDLERFGSAGCGTDPQSDNADSEQIVVRPQGYRPDRLHPVVMFAVNPKVRASDFLLQSGWFDLADSEGIILLSPYAGRHDWRAVDPELVAFSELLEQSKRNECIDLRRIYFVGSFRGGRIALATAASSSLTAISVSSMFMEGEVAQAYPNLRVPLIWLHPRNSAKLPLKGETSCTADVYPHYRDTDRFWQRRNGCVSERTKTYQKNGGTCHQWACEVPFATCLYQGGLQWPGVRYDGWWPTCPAEPASQFPATERVWAFFKSAPPLEL